MKKINLIFMIVFLLYRFPISILANSGPVYWEGHPSSEMMVVDRDSPIIVEQEDLIFDFSSEEEFYLGSLGKVMASYEMYNSSDEAQLVKMVFPLVGRVASYDPKRMQITVDDKHVPFQVFIGEIVYEDKKEKSFEFENIITNISKHDYTPKSFMETDRGKLFRIKVRPTLDHPIIFHVDLTFDHMKTKIFTKNFNGYSRTETATSITAWVNEEVNLEIFVLGEDVDFNVKAYKDGNQKEESQDFTFEKSEAEVEIGKYVTETIEVSNEGMLQPHLNSFFLESLDEMFSYNQGYSSWGDLLDQMYHDRILSLVYEVEFLPHARQNVTVSSFTNGSMDKRETIDPLYSFNYIVNPANYWSDFNNLSIEIIPPKVAPYIVNSSIPLVRQEDNHYTASLTDLPKEDLTFTLYSEEEITFKNKVTAYWYYALLFISLLIAGGFYRKKVNAMRRME